MSKFLYLMRGGEESFASMTPEQHGEHMQKWGAYMGGLGDALVDGLPLDGGGNVMTTAGNTNEPYTDGGKVGGYLIVEAADMDAANGLAKGCPIFETGGSLEIRECANMG